VFSRAATKVVDTVIVIPTEKRFITRVVVKYVKLQGVYPKK